MYKLYTLEGVLLHSYDLEMKSLPVSPKAPIFLALISAQFPTDPTLYEHTPDKGLAHRSTLSLDMLPVVKKELLALALRLHKGSD